MQAVRLGNYQVLLELAAGGMATVYVAKHVGGAGFERLVVIKRVHAHLVKDQAFTDMFLDEARVCSTIRHPNVVPVIDVVETGSELLLVLEYVESLSLSALLGVAAKNDTKLPPAVVSRILVDALAGLHAAHEAVDLRGNKIELIHRDVSPQNVIVGADGASRLIDFGIAKAQSRITTTVDGVVKGKIRYMSPEQVRQKPLDRRADVFAAGVVLYEALTGVRPFPGEDAADIAMSILLGDAPPPSSLVPELPRALDDVLVKALASDRDERYATAADLQEALERALPPASAREVATVVQRLAGPDLERRRAELQAALASASDTTVAEPPAGPRRGWVLGAVLAAAALSAAVVASIAMRRPAPVTTSLEASAAAREPLRESVHEAPATETPAAVPPSSSSAPTPTPPPTTSASPRATKHVERTRPAASTDLHRRNPYVSP